jgi:hypothetical protein
VVRYNNIETKEMREERTYKSTTLEYYSHELKQIMSSEVRRQPGKQSTFGQQEIKEENRPDFR